jgi:hypothetical protein
MYNKIIIIVIIIIAYFQTKPYEKLDFSCILSGQMIAGWGCETGWIGIPMIGTGDLLHPNQKQPIGPVNHHGKSHMKIMKTEFSSYIF